MKVVQIGRRIRVTIKRTLKIGNVTGKNLFNPGVTQFSSKQIQNPQIRIPQMATTCPVTGLSKRILALLRLRSNAAQKSEHQPKTKTKRKK